MEPFALIVWAAVALVLTFVAASVILSNRKPLPGSFAPSPVPGLQSPSPAASLLPPKPLFQKPLFQKPVRPDITQLVISEATSLARSWVTSSLGVAGSLVVVSAVPITRSTSDTVLVTIRDAAGATYVVDARRYYGMGSSYGIPKAWVFNLDAPVTTPPMPSAIRPAPSAVVLRPAPSAVVLRPAPSAVVLRPAAKPSAAAGNCTATGPWPKTKKACVDKMYRYPLWTAEMSPVLTYPPKRRCVKVPVDCNGPTANPSANLYSSEAECKYACSGGPPVVVRPPPPPRPGLPKPNCAYDNAQPFQTAIGCLSPPKTVYSFVRGVCTPFQQDCNGPRGGPERNLFPTMTACRSSCGGPLPR